MSWRTIPLLKSSIPTYTPCVTRYPPSTCSSLILRSRSLSLVTLSFSNLRASLSCFVSRLASRLEVSGSLLPPIPRNERSGRLPLRGLDARLGRGGKSVGGGKGSDLPAALVDWLARPPDPRDSFVCELPMVAKLHPILDLCGAFMSSIWPDPGTVITRHMPLSRHRGR